MRSVRVSHTRILVALLLGIAACSGGSGGGGPLSCGGGCMQPLPSQYDGPKTNNAVNAKISGAGFDYLNANWAQLLTAFTTNPIHIPIACAPQNLPLVGTTYICDQNLDKCGSASSCDVVVTIENFALTPNDAPAQDTGIVHGTATLIIQTGNIYLRTDDDSLGECLWLSGLQGHINFDSTRSAPPDYTLAVDVDFSLDGRTDPVHPQLTFDVANIQGLDQIDAADLSMGGDNNCGSIYFGLGNFLTQDVPAITNFIIQQLQGTLQDQIHKAVEKQKCRKCGTGLPACPTGQNGGSDSYCDSNSGTCLSNADNTCVPITLGIEGLVQPGQLLGKYGVPPDASMAISAVAGGSVSSAGPGSPGTGLTLGVIGGAQSETGDPPHLAPCVPDLPAPTGTAPAVPDFDGQSPVPGYHVGIGVSDFFMNQGAYEAHRSGTMCISIDGDTIQLLNTGLFKTFLPSLGLLAGSSTQDAPMLVALRPLQAPTIDIGAGTFDPVTKKPIDPLLTVTMHDVVIDIYALIEDRWSRLFTMTLDVQLPLSLIIDGCPQGVTPALGDLKNLITITHAPSNSELLAEDPAVLQGLIPAVISLAQPALATALKPINVPAVNGFTLHLDGMLGIGNRAVLADGGPGTYDDLGVFGEIAQEGVCDAMSVHTQASLAEAFIPTAAQMHPAPGQNLPWPSAKVRVDATGYDGEVEYGYRVDDGLWTTFKPGPVLTVSDPRFLIEGHHTIEVRGRPAHGKGISDPNPAKVDFLVDWASPAVKIARDASGAFAVNALDNVSGPQVLQYRYAVGDGNFSAWGPARPIDAQAIEDAGKLTVEVKDEAGNVGTTTWRGAAAVATSGITPPKGSELKGGPTGGCSTGGGSALAGLLALGLVLAARRRR